jgi:uncharacterized protein (DUF2141 family)
MKNLIKKIVKYLFVLIFVCKPMLAQNESGNITLTVDKISDLKGVLKIALYNSKESYDEGNAYKTMDVKVKNRSEIVVFENIDYGEYAIKMYHDVNENKKMDKGLFGIPTEPYGFSNDASGFMGPASYEKAKFIHNSQKTENKINL